jgi:hypothetical protein
MCASWSGDFTLGRHLLSEALLEGGHASAIGVGTGTNALMMSETLKDWPRRRGHHHYHDVLRYRGAIVATGTRQC